MRFFNVASGQPLNSTSPIKGSMWVSVFSWNRNLHYAPLTWATHKPPWSPTQRQRYESKRREGKEGLASRNASTSTNNVTQIFCVMLPRRSLCGSGSIYAVWFLLEGYWPILGAYCDPHTRITTQRESHLRWHDAEHTCCVPIHGMSRSCSFECHV